MDHSQRLGEEGILRLLLTFSVPAIVGMMAMAFYNIVDRIFIGHAVGRDGLAGVTLAFPFMLIVMAFGTLIGVGTTTLVSIRLGERRHDEAEQILGHGVLLLVMQALILTAVGLAFMDPLLRLFGATEAALPFARDYLQIIVLGTVFQAVGFGLNAVIRGEGNSQIAMFTMLIGAFLNVLLNPIFLFGLGWGMRGAAFATILSQLVAAIWVLRYFLGGRSLLRIRLKNMWLRWPICTRIMAIGSPLFTMQLAGSVLNGILNNQLVAYGGNLAVSVMGIIYAVVMFINMPIFGINQGAQPIIGYNYGALKFHRVKATLQTAILVATAISTSGFLLVVLFPSSVIGLFNRGDQDLFALGTHAIRLTLLMLPIVGFQIVSAGYFQAVGKPRQALLLGLSRQLLLLIPAVLILPWFFGLNGVWLAIPAADLGSSILTGCWLVFELRHLRRRHARQALQASAEQKAGKEDTLSAPRASQMGREQLVPSRRKDDSRDIAD